MDRFGESRLDRRCPQGAFVGSDKLGIGDTAEVDREVHLEFEQLLPGGLRDVHVPGFVGRSVFLRASFGGRIGQAGIEHAGDSVVDEGDDIGDLSLLQAAEIGRQRGGACGKEIDQLDVVEVGGGGPRKGQVDRLIALSYLNQGRAECFVIDALATQVFGDFCVTPVDKQTASDGQLVTGLQNSQLHRSTVDTGTVGTVEIGQDDVITIFLELGVEAADTFVVELNAVVVFAADCHGCLDIGKDTTTFEAFEDLDGDFSHRNSQPTQITALTVVSTAPASP